MTHFTQTMQARVDKLHKEQKEWIWELHNYQNVKQNKAMKLRIAGIKEKLIEPTPSELRFIEYKKGLPRVTSMQELKS